MKKSIRTLVTEFNGGMPWVNEKACGHEAWITLEKVAHLGDGSNSWLSLLDDMIKPFMDDNGVPRKA